MKPRNRSLELLAVQRKTKKELLTLTQQKLAKTPRDKILKIQKGTDDSIHHKGLLLLTKLSQKISLRTPVVATNNTMWLSTRGK